MLLLNPEHLKATQDPLLPRQHLTPAYASIVRVTLAALTGIAAVFIGYGVTEYIGGNWPAWAAVLPLAAFVLLATLTTVVTDEARWQFGFALAWGACTAFALPWRTTSEALLIAAVVAGFAVSAFWAYRVASSSYTTLHLFTLTRKYASTLATGVVVGLIVLYGSAVIRGSALLPQGVLAGITDQAASFVPTLLPGATPQSGSSTLSVGDLALASARAQLESDPRYRALDPSEQARVLAEAAESATAGLIKQLGAPASSTASSSVGSVAQGAFTTMLQNLQEKYGLYFVAAWLLAAFFIARSAAVVLTFVVAGFSWLIVTGAVALRLLHIEAVPSLHERITL